MHNIISRRHYNSNLIYHIDVPVTTPIAVTLSILLQVLKIQVSFLHFFFSKYCCMASVFNAHNYWISLYLTCVSIFKIFQTKTAKKMHLRLFYWSSSCIKIRCTHYEGIRCFISTLTTQGEFPHLSMWTFHRTFFFKG